jgi:hypothetical protein
MEKNYQSSVLSLNYPLFVSKKPSPPNGPSKTGNPSGLRRGNNPPSQKTPVKPTRPKK